MPESKRIYVEGWRRRRARMSVEVCPWGEVNLNGEFPVERHMREWVNATVAELQADWDRGFERELRGLLG